MKPWIKRWRAKYIWYRAPSFRVAVKLSVGQLQAQVKAYRAWQDGREAPHTLNL